MTSRNKPYNQKDINYLLSNYGKETSFEIGEKIGMKAGNVRLLYCHYRKFCANDLQKVPAKLLPFFQKYNETLESQTPEVNKLASSQLNSRNLEEPVPPALPD